MHRASFKVVADHPVATPKDEGQEAARPEVRVVVAASSVIDRPSRCRRAVARTRNDSIEVE